MDVENEVVMSELTRMIREKFTQHIAMRARQFAQAMRPEITGKQALEAFADAIESTDEKLRGQNPRSWD